MQFLRRLGAASLVVFACARAFALTHPGILSSRADIDFIKRQLQAGAQPWKTAYGKLSSSSFASLSYKPNPVASVDCGRYSSPNRGCTEELNDATAAYTHALLWALGGDAAHAKKAIEIMNAWPPVLKQHTLANATLQAGWSISVMMRGAELIRHTGAGWADADVARFSAMLRDVYLRDLRQKQGGVDGLISIFGNWDLTIIEGITAIGVFLDDEAVFQEGVARWRKRVPAYLYLASDGAQPVAPPDAPDATRAQIVSYWFGQDTFKDGLSEETCRDLIHFEYGLAAAADVAEIAWNQGLDLYAEESRRLTATMEFNAPFMTGTGAPAWLCKGTFQRPTAIDTWEIAYNHYHNRMGMALPNTEKIIAKVRPTGTNKHMAWETMTHAGLGSQGASSTKGQPPPGIEAARARGMILLFDGAGRPSPAVSRNGVTWTLAGKTISPRARVSP